MNPPQIIGQGGPLLRPTDYQMAQPMQPINSRMAPPAKLPAPVPNFVPPYPPTPAPTFQQYMAMKGMTPSLTAGGSGGGFPHPYNQPVISSQATGREDPNQMSRPSQEEMNCTNAGYYFNPADGKCYG